MEINAVELKEVAKSAEGMCAAESRRGKGTVLLRVAAPKADKMRWMEAHSLWVEKHLNRVFVPVIIKDRFWWMDAITGTFYDLTGKCRGSATLYINVACLRNNVKKAEKILLESAPGDCKETNESED